MNQSQVVVETANDQSPGAVGSMILLSINLFLLVCIDLIFARAVPAFKDIYADFGHVEKLPWMTRVFISISDSIMTFHGMVFVLFSASTIFALVWAYKELRRRKQGKLLITSMLSTMFALLFIIALITVAIFLPICGFHEVVGGIAPSP